ATGAAERSGSVDDAAGPRLLDQQLDGLAQSVGRDHAESSQRQEPEPPALAQPAPESEDAGGRLEGEQTEFGHGSHRRGQCRALGETGDCVQVPLMYWLLRACEG